MHFCHPMGHLRCLLDTPPTKRSCCLHKTTVPGILWREIVTGKTAFRQISIYNMGTTEPTKYLAQSNRQYINSHQFYTSLTVTASLPPTSNPENCRVQKKLKSISEPQFPGKTNDYTRLSWQCGFNLSQVETTTSSSRSWQPSFLWSQV